MNKEAPFMSRLICILMLALLCLPAGTQATPLASPIAGATADLSDMSKATLTLGRGTANWRVKEFLGDSGSGLRVGEQSVGKFSMHASVAMSDELGGRGGEASPDNGHSSSAIKAGASIQKSLLVSGDGHGSMPLPTPLTQDIMRSTAMVIDRQGTSLPINNGIASVSLVGANDSHREQQATRSFGRNDGSTLDRTHAGSLIPSELLSPKRSLGGVGAEVADVRAVSLLEPSSMIFLSCALLALVIFPRWVRP
jgi:hypothetical protein